MNTSHPRRVRVHGRLPQLVVAGLLAALFFLARTPGADGAPVDPVPAGVWPLQPRPQVLRGFEPPDSRWTAGHRGVDLAGAVGQVVHTSLAGRVVFAARLAGRGVVVVDHGSTRTTYEPVSSLVRVGQVLVRGQALGTLELAGSHCLPRSCLHWGWKRGHTYLDPLLLVGGGPIVLLPLWRDLGGQPTAAAPALPYAEQVSQRLAQLDGRARDRPRRTPTTSATGPVWHRPLAMRPVLM